MGLNQAATQPSTASDSHKSSHQPTLLCKPDTRPIVDHSLTWLSALINYLQAQQRQRHVQIVEARSPLLAPSSMLHRDHDFP